MDQIDARFLHGRQLFQVQSLGGAFQSSEGDVHPDNLIEGAVFEKSFQKFAFTAP